MARLSRWHWSARRRPEFWAASRRSAPRTTAGSVVGQNGGSDARRKLAVPLGGQPRVEHGDHAPVLLVRSSRPAPWASSSAAWDAATCMNPLPPRPPTARCRAEASGSSGRGNGIRSMTTSRSDGPGTSTPCHRDSVPNRQRGLVLGELPDELRRRVVALAEQGHAERAAERKRGLPRGPHGREQAEGAAARRGDQLAELGQIGRREPVPAGWGQMLGDVQDAAAGMVEGRADVQAGPGQSVPGRLLR